MALARSIESQAAAWWPARAAPHGRPALGEPVSTPAAADLTHSQSSRLPALEAYRHPPKPAVCPPLCARTPDQLLVWWPRRHPTMARASAAASTTPQPRTAPQVSTAHLLLVPVSTRAGCLSTRASSARAPIFAQLAPLLCARLHPHTAGLEGQCGVSRRKKGGWGGSDKLAAHDSFMRMCVQLLRAG